ncbi:MAG: twitching motility protein PilT [Candidatus Peregrinibacteria bacterium Greene0416_62]|nr:MAG: twitching motility protein PilT [Candidatus Peregrinibacteria bacterium Greene0416_62]
MPSGLDQLFVAAVKAGASDIHLAMGSPVVFRIDGILVPQGKKVLTGSDIERAVKSILGADRFKEFERTREMDSAYAVSNVRLRVNCHFEKGVAGLTARIIPQDIPSIADVGLVTVADALCNLTDGLVLFTGPTGSGKSTSLAAIIHKINQERSKHIVTLEDPVEFLFPEGKGIIRQRQFGSDFLSFPEALKHVLRQDPDIVMVGEMRDLETIAAALTIAETGHLVFATLHTPNAVQTVDRIVDVFPPYQQQQVRIQLSLALKAIVAQRLIPKVGGGRVAQREILVTTPAVGHIIRDNRSQELKSVLQTGRDTGMTTFENDAKRLLKEGVISKETWEWARV